MNDDGKGALPVSPTLFHGPLVNTAELTSAA